MRQAGDTLDKYSLLRLLGSGGMADVHEAEDLALGRRVALKMLHPELSRSGKLVSRFEAEVRGAASLNHVGIVPIFDSGSDGGTLFFSMRLLSGGNLRERIRTGLVDAQDALLILRQAAEALGYAHRQTPTAFIHRHLKPTNILFDEQGKVVITDFGIAKVMDLQHGLSATGFGVGNASYMSPEQARGRKDIDHRADIYSLGAVFFEMLTGLPPYQADEQISVILAHVSDPIPILPEPLAQYQPLITSMLAKAPDRRPVSMEAVVDLVDGYLPAFTHRSSQGFAGNTGATRTTAARRVLSSSSTGGGFIVDTTRFPALTKRFSTSEWSPRKTPGEPSMTAQTQAREGARVQAEQAFEDARRRTEESSGLEVQSESSPTASGPATGKGLFAKPTSVDETTERLVDDSVLSMSPAAPWSDKPIAVAGRMAGHEPTEGDSSANGPRNRSRLYAGLGILAVIAAAFAVLIWRS